MVITMEVANEIALASIAQRAYCDASGSTYFAPDNGICYHCGRNIYQTYGESRGISQDEASHSLITGCPHCNYSFCE